MPIKGTFDPYRDDAKCVTRQYSVSDDGKFFRGMGITASVMPAGPYVCHADIQRTEGIMEAVKIEHDEIVQFPDSLFSRTLDDIRDFWKKRVEFERYGYLHRRGMLFYGPQGCGKTMLINQVANQVIEEGNIVMYGEPLALQLCCETVRAVEPDRPIICILEDVDTIVASSGEETLLQWLDGNAKANSVLTIATTNYPEQLNPA